MSKDIQVSIVASANRPILRDGFKNWERFVNSLSGNKINIEVVFVGNVPCPHPMPDNFRWIESHTKPAQCYEIGFRAAKGELIHWSADDANYNHPQVNCPNTFDRGYAHFKEFEEKYKDKKTIIAMRPIEDGGDVYDFHHFFGGWHHTPVMAPFALIDREWFVNKLGGYDRRFVSGQSENDVVMRGIEDGGRVELCLDCYLYVHHRQVHPRNNQGAEDNKFRAWYPTDRQVLEDCWVVGGYGKYERNIQDTQISPKRLSPVERFDDKDICTVTQGIKGIW